MQSRVCGNPSLSHTLSLPFFSRCSFGLRDHNLISNVASIALNELNHSIEWSPLIPGLRRMPFHTFWSSMGGHSLSPTQTGLQRGSSGGPAPGVPEEPFAKGGGPAKGKAAIDAMRSDEQPDEAADLRKVVASGLHLLVDLSTPTWEVLHVPSSWPLFTGASGRGGAWRCGWTGEGRTHLLTCQLPGVNLHLPLL
jgi:hypothetical protein